MKKAVAYLTPLMEIEKAKAAAAKLVNGPQTVKTPRTIISHAAGS